MQGDGGALAGASADATKGPYTTLHEEVFAPAGCASHNCHASAAGGLTMTQGDSKASHQALIAGKTGSKDKAKCKAVAYVVAGKPDESLLWLKIDAAAIHGCGAKMPPPKGNLAGGLSATDAAKVRAWIAAGAVF